MNSLKRITVLALVMVALIIPVIAVSESASGAANLEDDSIRSVGGFTDRADGTVTVRVYDVNEGDVVTVSIGSASSVPFRAYGGASRTVTATAAHEETGFIDVSISFRLTEPGNYKAVAVITGDDVSDIQYRQTFSFDVGRSIWSSVWTYVAIIVVIVIIGIVLFIRMRAQPKVDNAGAFTAMEEERQVKRRSSTKKEEYKGRSKN